MRRALLPFSVALLFTLASCNSPGPVAPPENVTYADVQAVFDAHCVECHGDDDPEGDLVLLNRASLMKGGEDGPVIVAGNPDRSRLNRMVEWRQKPYMPFVKKGRKKKLPADAIAILRAWVADGAR